MKNLGLYFLVLSLVGAGSVLSFGSSDTISSSSSSASDAMHMHQLDKTANPPTGRKFKENGNYLGSGEKISEKGSVSLDDYRPVDPAPSSKASIKPAPIEHGTPLNPFIPKPPPPPGPPNDGV